MKTKGINHLALVCHDMAETVKFYTEALGMPLVKTVELPGGGQHFFFDCGGDTLLAFFWWADAPPAAACFAWLDSGGGNLISVSKTTNLHDAIPRALTLKQGRGN